MEKQNGYCKATHNTYCKASHNTYRHTEQVQAEKERLLQRISSDLHSVANINMRNILSTSVVFGKKK